MDCKGCLPRGETLSTQFTSNNRCGGDPRVSGRVMAGEKYFLTVFQKHHFAPAHALYMWAIEKVNPRKRPVVKLHGLLTMFLCHVEQLHGMVSLTFSDRQTFETALVAEYGVVGGAGYLIWRAYEPVTPRGAKNPCGRRQGCATLREAMD